MANDSLSSLVSQSRKALDALAIETQEKFAGMQKSLEDEVITTTQKKVRKELSDFEKVVDRLLGDARKRLEQELTQQLTRQITQSLLPGGAGSGYSAGGQSQGQFLSQFSNLLSSAFRNL